MNLIIPGISPNPIQSLSPAAPKTTEASPVASSPAATVEISAAARSAFGTVPGQPPLPKFQPSNVIWGNGAR